MKEYLEHETSTVQYFFPFFWFELSCVLIGSGISATPLGSQLHRIPTPLLFDISFNDGCLNLVEFECLQLYKV